ncbi:uncharacterized protein LOC111134410 [Crassostrea virginica]
MSTYTGTLLSIICKYYRAPYRFDDEDDSSDDDCTKKSATIRKSPRKEVPRQRIPPPLPLLSELTTTTARPQTATPPEQPRETMQSSIGAPNLPTLVEKSKTSQPSPFELKILTCLAQLKTQVHQNTKLLQALHKKTDAVDLPEREGFDISIFPLKTKAGLEELEEHLKIAEVFSQLVNTLSTTGGENTKTTVRKILAYIFTNKLATGINWIGKGGKIAFSSLRVKDVLTKTVRKNRLTGSATDSEIEAGAKDWFRFASDRDGGRKKRENRKRDEQGLQGVTKREDRE